MPGAKAAMKARLGGRKYVRSSDYRSKKALHKQPRSLDQEKRKTWGKQQAMLHTHGDADVTDSEDDDDDVDDDDGNVNVTDKATGGNVVNTSGPDVSASDDGKGKGKGKSTVKSKCRYGSISSHSRTLPTDCPLNETKSKPKS